MGVQEIPSSSDLFRLHARPEDLDLGFKASGTWGFELGLLGPVFGVFSLDGEGVASWALLLLQEGSCCEEDVLLWLAEVPNLDDQLP